MGLPEPVTLVREDPKEPHKLSGQVLWGNSHGAAFEDAIGQCLKENKLIVGGTPMGVKGHLIYDASGIASAEQSSQLHTFFSAKFKSTGPQWTRHCCWLKVQCHE